MAFAQGLTESISSRLHQIRDRAGWAAGGAGRRVPTANLLRPTWRLARPRSAYLRWWCWPVWHPGRRHRGGRRGGVLPSAGAPESPLRAGPPCCREEAVAPAMGAQPWQAPAKAQATVSRHKLQTRTNTVGATLATLLSFDDLVPGVAGAPPTASPRALPAPSPPPARTGSPSEEEVTSKCCHDGLIRLFSTSRPLRRRESR